MVTGFERYGKKTPADIVLGRDGAGGALGQAPYADRALLIRRARNRPERKLRPSKTWGKGQQLAVHLAAQDAHETEDARTEQQDAAGLRSGAAAF